MRNHVLRASIAALLAVGALVAPSRQSLGAQVSPTAILDRARVDARRPIDFHAAAFPESVYVGQQSTYQVAVFLTQNARSRLRRNPEFIPPELRGLLAYEIGRPRPVAPRAYGGVSYEAVVFQRALFPVAAGKLDVPSPQLSYALPQSASYFSREERHVVRAESAHLVVRPLPEEGRPDGFAGAVGVLEATARLDTGIARVGDPLVLTMRVQGVGNVKLLPRPVLELPWASAVPGTERVQIDTTGPLVRGWKEFDWILTPTAAGRVQLPALRYEHFDPYARRYVTAMTDPVEVPIQAGSLAQADLGESAALQPLQPLRASVAPGVASRLVLDLDRLRLVGPLVVLLAPLPALLLALRRRRGLVPVRARARGGVRDPLGGLASLDAAGAESARQARRTLHSALADRLGVPTQALVSRAQVRRLLRRRGVTRDGTRRVLDGLDELDARGFAGTASGSTSDARVARECYEIVDAEAMRGGAETPGGRAGRLLILIAVLPLAASALIDAPLLHAQALQAQAAADADGDQSSSSLVERAAEAYAQRQFQDAAQRYADLAAQHPDDTDLLANWGTAAWAAGDTVSAVIAWQRAARDDPLAADIQERVSMLPSGARGGVAEVPMVPVATLATIALACWLFGWLAVAWQLRTAPTGAPGLEAPRDTQLARAAVQGVAWTCLFTAVVAGGVAWWGHRALDARELAVVARPETMHVAPGTDADAMGGVSTGDVVKRLDGQGAWQRVLHADGRRGWLPRTRLVDIMPQRSDSLSIDPALGTGVDSIGVSAVPVRP